MCTSINHLESMYQTAQIRIEKREKQLRLLEKAYEEYQRINNSGDLKKFSDSPQEIIANEDL